MPTRKASSEAEDEELSAGRILVAFEKLFGGGRAVKRFARSGLRYVDLAGGAVLVEQNPKKQSEWAELAHSGHRVAWVLRDGEYLARVVDGKVKKKGERGKGKGESVDTPRGVNKNLKDQS